MYPAQRCYHVCNLLAKLLLLRIHYRSWTVSFSTWKVNKLTITASDAETRLVTSVDVMNAQGSGLFAVSAKILLDPLKELPEQPLTFDINDDKPGNLYPFPEW